MFSQLKIEVFLDVCETLNFTRTAERLYLTQQGVSRHIADLERDLGVKLFDRSPHHMELTPAGAEARGLFTGFAQGYRGYLKRWRTQGGQRQGDDVLRLGYQDFLRFGSALRDGFRLFAKHFPGVSVEGRRSDPAELKALLGSGDIDAAITLSRFLRDGEGYAVRKLRPSQLMLYVAADHPLNRQKGDYLKFKDEPLLVNAYEGEDPARALRRERRKVRARGFTPSEIIVLTNRGSIYTEGYMGRGVFFGSAYADIPEDVPLVGYPTPFDDSFCFVYPAAGENEGLRTLADCLEQTFRTSEVKKER